MWEKEGEEGRGRGGEREEGEGGVVSLYSNTLTPLKVATTTALNAH